MKAKELRALIEGVADDQEIELCIDADEMRMWSGRIESASLQAGETGNPCIVVQCSDDEVNCVDAGPLHGNAENDHVEVVVRGNDIH